MKQSILDTIKELKKEAKSKCTEEKVQEALTQSKSFLEKAAEVLTVAAKVSTVLAKATENKDTAKLIHTYINNHYENTFNLYEGLVNNHYKDCEVLMNNINAAPHDEEQQNQEYAA